MTRRDVRRILSDLAGVDPEQDAGIEVQLHARTPGPRGTHTVTTVRMVDLTHALADLVERQSKEAVQRAEERAHRAEIKVTELQLAARKEREMSAEMTERGETVSLHERLREAAYTSFPSYIQGNKKSWTFSGIPDSDLVAIETAIREDATAPLRAEVAEADELGKVVRANYRRVVEEYNALKARADALRMAGMDYYRKLNEASIADMAVFRAAIEAYDAADRAGETQETGLTWEGVVDGQFRRYSTVAAPSPTDAAAGEEGRIAGHERSLVDLDLSVKSILTQLNAMGLVQEDDSKAIADLERWREGVDSLLNLRREQIEVLLQDRRDFQRWREDVGKHMDTHCTRINAQREALLANDERLLALEARQGGVPEIVKITDAVINAYWTGTGANLFFLSDSMRETIAKGLHAALSVMGTGGGR